MVSDCRICLSYLLFVKKIVVLVRVVVSKVAFLCRCVVGADSCISRSRDSPLKVAETKQRRIDAFVRTSTYRVWCLRMRREAASELITKGRCREEALRECAKVSQAVSVVVEGGRKWDWMWAMERERRLGDRWVTQRLA
ncbi:hypothetical protein K440DRAFT_386061 [Wilcoxina mikolae CBS 423.85]|nr:hypothetical protein K440DRAFT_386061 [Wilcoxina mikolae CBS 423.85]